MGYARAGIFILFLASLEIISGSPITQIQAYEAESAEEGSVIYHFEWQSMTEDAEFEAKLAAEAAKNNVDNNEPDEVIKEHTEAHFLRSIITDSLAMVLIFAIPCLGLTLFLVVMFKERKSRLRRRAALKSAEKYEMF